MPKLTSLIYDTLEKEEEKKRWIPKAHYPSSASFKYSDGTLVGPDLLTSYLKWTGVPPSNPSNGASLLKMRMGDGAHKELATILGKANIKAVPETGAKVPVPGLTYPVSYRTDVLAEIDGKLKIIEVKSSQEQQMFNRQYGICVKGPKTDHLLQVICYLELVPGADSALLLYIDRGTGGMLEFTVTKGSEGGYLLDGKPIPEIRWSGIIARWVVLEEALVAKVEPESEYHCWLNEKTGEVMAKKTIKGEDYKSDWRCLYNDYKDFIWKNPKNYKQSYNFIYSEAIKNGSAIQKPART